MLGCRMPWFPVHAGSEVQFLELLCQAYGLVFPSWVEREDDNGNFVLAEFSCAIFDRPVCQVFMADRVHSNPL